MQRKRLTRLLTGLCVLLAVAMATPVLTGCGGDEAGKVYKIGISQIVTHPALDATREGIIDGMTQAGTRRWEQLDRLRTSSRQTDSPPHEMTTRSLSRLCLVPGGV